MMGHKICFNEEIWIIIPKLSLLLLLIWSTAYNYLNIHTVLVQAAKGQIRLLLRNTLMRLVAVFKQFYNKSHIG